jgi:hypothetical protein
MTQPPLLPEPRLILEKHAQALARVRLSGRRQGAAKPPFLKRSCALLSVFG